ncbi:hypothetical protein K3495_g15012, partial [Podosphaera aphanis]
MDRLNVYFNNTANQLVQNGRTIPVLRRWGHPWLAIPRTKNAALFLTETELRRLHRRFGHPSTDRLYKLLSRAGHEGVSKETLSEISKFCHHCQLHGSAPKRFKFSLKDDREFNYEILADIMYLDSKPVLHVVDSATSFQAAQFLTTMSAKETWQTLRLLWIDTYQGPPDVITHDAGTNFSSVEFRNEARILGITCREVPVEAHWSIGKLERYHAPLRRAYEILSTELRGIYSPKAVLQMAVKAVNDTAGPDGLVPTLLVFGAYPRINLDSPPSPNTVQRAEAVQKAMKALRKISAERQSEVRVWREKKGWQGPFKILSIDGHSITLDLPHGPTAFRSTVVQPYYRNSETERQIESLPDPDTNDKDNSEEDGSEYEDPTLRPKRGRGRPPASINKRRPMTTYFSRKEEGDRLLAIKLRNDGIITALGAPFEESDAKEINNLIGRGVFSFELFDEVQHGQHRLFKSRMVREIKGKTDKPYEKSRLVIQGYNDHEKNEILTQSPTIQRMSQRLILALAPSLLKQGLYLELRDITQAYPQSQTNLNRVILASLPTELRSKYAEGTIIRVIKPLYGIAEAGVHWFATYQ